MSAFLNFCWHWNAELIFQRMDIERRRQEARDMKRKPRLIEAEELPPDFLKTVEELDVMNEKPYGSLGPRQKKEVDYSHDSWSDRQWLKVKMFDNEVI